MPAKSEGFLDLNDNNNYSVSLIAIIMIIGLHHLNDNNNSSIPVIAIIIKIEPRIMQTRTSIGALSPSEGHRSLGDNNNYTNKIANNASTVAIFNPSQ